MGDGLVIGLVSCLLVVLNVVQGRICPSRCLCHEDILSVSCTDAQLQVFPIQLNPQVQKIEVSGNGITNIHNSLAFYYSLLNLDVSSNKITTLGKDNFEQQINLVFLNASHNHIAALGKDVFKGLKSLQVLDLSHNHIEEVDGLSFRDIQNIIFLDLSSNKITSLSEPIVFRHLSNLKELKLDSNEILDIPSAVLKNFPTPCSLEILSLNNNYIDNIQDNAFPHPCAGSLKSLSISGNAIKDIEEAAFSNLINLEILNISFNNLTLIPTQELSKLSSLQDLDLSGNTFTEVKSVAFQSLFNLNIIRLSKLPFMNRFDVRAFVDNVRLETVIMDENVELKRLPPRVFFGNHHLLRISLRGNSISTFEASHFPVDKLRWLDLSENPLNCNCSLFWLWTLAQLETKLPEYNESSLMSNDEGQQLRIAVQKLKCYEPESIAGRVLTNINESYVRCETTWLTVAIITALVLALFGAFCVILLFFNDKKLCSCNREKQQNDVTDIDTRRLATGLHSVAGPPPILMLMPDKHYQDAILENYLKTNADLKYVEPWLETQRPQNPYVPDVTHRKPQVVYV